MHWYYAVILHLPRLPGTEQLSVRCTGGEQTGAVPGHGAVVLVVECPLPRFILE